MEPVSPNPAISCNHCLEEQVGVVLVDGEFAVECCACGARGPLECDEETAIAAWNHRPFPVHDPQNIAIRLVHEFHARSAMVLIIRGDCGDAMAVHTVFGTHSLVLRALDQAMKDILSGKFTVVSAQPTQTPS